ncbi:MAG: hypothetical protein FJZ56_06040 [Chlamydiae bacterium]|nr:hypothetical protein [Chlamydiota bacterium]
MITNTSSSLLTINTDVVDQTDSELSTGKTAKSSSGRESHFYGFKEIESEEENLKLRRCSFSKSGSENRSNISANIFSPKKDDIDDAILFQKREEWLKRKSDRVSEEQKIAALADVHFSRNLEFTEIKEALK